MCDAAALPEACSHPDDVVVAPLDIQAVIVRKGVHDGVGCGPAIIDVADDVQVVDREALDQAAELIDECGFLPGRDDGVDDGLVVALAVHRYVVLVHELLDGVGEFLRERLAHLRARVLPGCLLAERDEALDGGRVPSALILYALKHELALLAGVVDQRGEVALLGSGQILSERILDLQADRARATPEQVGECLVFAMDVRGEYLRALGQAQDRAQIDDLGRCGGDVRECL